MFRTVSHLVALTNKLLVAYDTGDFDTFVIDGDRLLVTKSNKQYEHEGRILEFSVLGDHAVSVGSDCYVKVWCLSPKQLLRQIKFDSEVFSAAVINN
jgi:hypothetical protein